MFGQTPQKELQKRLTSGLATTRPQCFLAKAAQACGGTTFADRINPMVRYPRALWLHVIVAILGGVILGIGCALIAMRLSFEHWARVYPHDGQIGLGVVAVGLFSFPPLAILLGIVIFVVQRRYSAPKPPLSSKSGITSG
jgi:hypothetical protein